MCWLCCWINFWNTQYNTPRIFRLANYSIVFCDQCATLLQPTNHSNCIQALGCNTSNKYATLSHTNSQVGFVVKSAPPVTFHLLTFPLMQSLAFKQTFFPLHLLHCYNHPSLSDRTLAGLSRLV